MEPAIGNYSQNDSSSDLQNATIIGPAWDFLTGFSIFVLICSLLTNGILLLTILSTRSRQTAFSVYLINLLVANIIMAILLNIPDLFNHLYSAWPFSDAYCSVFIFGLYIMSAGTEFSHGLIAINRILAVYWPHSYRTRHNSKVACLLCLTGWIVVAVLILPGFMLDALYYRTDPAVYGCMLNMTAQSTWEITVQFLAFNMGIFIMWVTYPLICFKRRQSLKIGLGTKTGAVSLSRKLTGGDLKGTSTANDVYLDANGQQTGGGLNKAGQEGKVTSSHMMLLTVLTVSITICWTPINTLYTVMVFWPTFPVDESLLTGLNVLFSLQSVVDPILFICSLSYLRKSIFRKS